MIDRLKFKFIKVLVAHTSDSHRWRKYKCARKMETDAAQCDKLLQNNKASILVDSNVT